MSDIQEIEITMDAAKDAIKKKECIERLKKNPDFIEVIENGYLRDFAAQQVSELTAKEPYEGYRAEIHNSLVGVSELNGYLNMLLRNGRMSEQTLAEHQEYHADALMNA